MASDADVITELRKQAQEAQRLQWQTQDALSQAQSGQESALRRATTAEARVKGLQADALRATAVDRRCAELQRQLAEAKQSVIQLEENQMQTKQQLSEALAKLAAESEHHKRAQDAAEQADAERARLQRARDDSVSALRAAEARIRDAEDELDRAEQDAITARTELSSVLAGQRDTDGHVLSESDQTCLETAEQQVLELTLQLQAERQKSSALTSEAAARQHDAQQAVAECATLQQLVSQLKAERSTPQLQQPSGDGPGSALDLEAMRSLEVPVPAGSETTTSAHDAAPNSVASSFVVVKAGEDERSLDEEVIAALRGTRRRAAQLKAARDRLLVEVDGLSVQVEQLAAENSVLSEALAAAQNQEAAWQQRAQGGLAHSEHLTELLAESAAWPSDSATATASKGEETRQGQDGQLQTDEVRLALFTEQAHAAQLQLQVDALVMELARSDAASAALERATLPALGQVEAQLAAALHLQVA